MNQKQKWHLVPCAVMLAYFSVCPIVIIYAQDDPCIPKYRVSTCGGECGPPPFAGQPAEEYERCRAKCEDEERRKWDEEVSKCRAAGNKGGNSANTTNPRTPYKNELEDRRRAERENKARMEREEEERARERTRTFNEQKRGRRGTASGAEIVDPVASERTRAFNEQKRRQAAQSGGIPADPDISSGDDSPAWDVERRNAYEQRLKYANQRLLNGPAPKDKEVVEGCRWETVTDTIHSYGGALNTPEALEDGVFAYIADGRGSPNRRGAYMVINNMNRTAVFFGIGSQGGMVNSVIPPKSKRKVFVGRYVSKRVREITDELTVRYCVPVKE